MLNIDNNYELINQLNWRTLIMGSNDHSISKKKKNKNMYVWQWVQYSNKLQIFEEKAYMNDLNFPNIFVTISH